MTLAKPIFILAFTAGLALSGGAVAQTGNRVSVSQSGDGNEASVNISGHNNGQAEGSIMQAGDGAYAEITIEGDDNNFHVSQTGGGTANATVYGTGNNFSVDQINTYSEAYQNYSLVLQSGDENSVTLGQQVEAYGAAGGLNQAFAYQNGLQNEAALTQTGIGNAGTINQTGDENTALLTQDGVGNTGEVIQNGDGLSGELNQIGNNLSYSVTQSCITGVCDQAIIVNQTATGVISAVTGAGS